MNDANRAALALDDAHTLYNQYADFLDRFDAGAFGEEEVLLEVRLNEQVVEQLLAAVDTAAKRMADAGLGDARDAERVAALKALRQSATVAELTVGARAFTAGLAKIDPFGGPGMKSMVQVPDHSEAIYKVVRSMQDRLPRDAHRAVGGHEGPGYVEQGKAQRPVRERRAIQLAIAAVIGGVLKATLHTGFIANVGDIVCWFGGMAAAYHGFVAWRDRRRARPRLAWAA